MKVRAALLFLCLVPSWLWAAPVTRATVANSRPWMVVIDPGHGGWDPGAVGPGGVREKDVVFGVAEALYDRLRSNPHFVVRLTRSGDQFVPLRTRLRFARNPVADLFISIHADAYFNRGARGASVFALSEGGATSEAARWLAHQENHSELGHVRLANKSAVVRSVLIDLSQTATIEESVRIGRGLLNALRPIAALHRARVEQAPFVVLKTPDVPSVLVEVGFISNRLEAAQLRTLQYQRTLAEALYRGIVESIRR